MILASTSESLRIWVRQAGPTRAAGASCRQALSVRSSTRIDDLGTRSCPVPTVHCGFWILALLGNACDYERGSRGAAVIGTPPGFFGLRKPTLNGQLDA
jgi:hypothetical protein